MNEKELVIKAIEARTKSYAPYSKYKVGAALLTNEDEVILGCNIENAAYGPSNCAERTAFFKAISEGKRGFKAIAIVGGLEDEIDSFSDFAYPCGVCRQVMREFCDDSFVIYVAKNVNEIKKKTLGELLPDSFGPDNLK